MGRMIVEKDYLDQEKNFNSVMRRIERNNQMKQAVAIPGVKNPELLVKKTTLVSENQNQTINMSKVDSKLTIQDNTLWLNEFLTATQKKFINEDS